MAERSVTLLAAVVGALIIAIVLLGAYIVTLRQQIRSVNRQLTKRLTERTRQPVSLALMDQAMVALAVNVNRCLKAEETLRLDAVRKEKRFRELIANLSHDLRTPLTAIKGYQQLMGNGGLSPDQRQRLAVAQKHAGELGTLIEHFFEYAYLLDAEPVVHAERVNLTNLVAECLADSVAALEARDLAVRFDDEAPPVWALVDREMTVRIIKNLIRNGVQHADGDIEVRILAAQAAVISFRNPVRNAPEIDADQLFDRFYSADRARGKSTGLGLSIVRLLAEQMGGSTGASLQDGLLEIRVMLPL
jgi:signal transduction histidine kinase